MWSERSGRTLKYEKGARLEGAWSTEIMEMSREMSRETDRHTDTESKGIGGPEVEVTRISYSSGFIEKAATICGLRPPRPSVRPSSATSFPAHENCGMANRCCTELPAQRSSLRTVHICLEATLGGQGLFVASSAVRTCRICLTAEANTRYDSGGSNGGWMAERRLRWVVAKLLFVFLRFLEKGGGRGGC